MFDITSSKLLILAIVALIVVGPKDLPVLLRTIGKYLGIMRRHANEFRAQFDEAIREAELQDLRKEFEQVGQQVKSTMDEGARAIDEGAEAMRKGIDAPAAHASASSPHMTQSPAAPTQSLAEPEAAKPDAPKTDAPVEDAAAEPPPSEKTGT